ncbi:MAG: hypothetical protein U1C58_09255 [Flavobacteriaceae bacterium]|nr:hypothetical protein [Flavobacteriaceae bacterium]
MKYLRLIPLFFLTSCALQSITTEYETVKIEKENVLSELGNGKIMIYSGADWKHRIDNTAKINVWIDGKALGQLRPRQYAIVKMEKGEHKISLLHIDVVNMRSDHLFEIDENTKIIKIKPTITSNKAELTNELPEKWEVYEHMIYKK